MLDASEGLPNLPEGTYASLRVVDNGSGIEPESRPQIFDPFFTTKFAGCGLGLAALLGIIRALGGAIHVVSTPAYGSIFTVLLPVACEH